MHLPAQRGHSIQLNEFSLWSTGLVILQHRWNKLNRILISWYLIYLDLYDHITCTKEMWKKTGWILWIKPGTEGTVEYQRSLEGGRGGGNKNNWQYFKKRNRQPYAFLMQELDPYNRQDHGKWAYFMPIFLFYWKQVFSNKQCQTINLVQNRNSEAMQTYYI